MIKDLVSVIIPTFNRAHLIKRSAMSVLNQTYDNLELIIVDDGSTDNTEEVVKSIDDKRIIYIKQPNQGACAARNTGIDHAKGEFIAFQDSDDVWHDNKLEKQMETLRKTGADLVFCPLNMFKKDKDIGLLGWDFQEGMVSASDVLTRVGTQSLFAKENVFKDEKFDVEMPRLQDFEILIRIQNKYKIYCLNEALVDYCVQEESISANPYKMLSAIEILLQKYPRLYNSQKFANMIINVAAETCNNKTKKEMVVLAHRICPSAETRFRTITLPLLSIHFFKTLYKSIAKKMFASISFLY